ncbi:helix-turn-helix domain-containing protein [Streptosporangium longisporum]|uniref:HTH cro/C1-type domain-containing protein n=1 Tax=Streptosporangium longisporum TaxID=46187 RepID=A0ABP6KHC2_9ACTN
MSDDLPEPTRVLLQELRALRERAGLDLRALEQATHASRSTWGRWLSGETWIPLDAVEGLARLCREDERRFRRLWEAAERDRRAADLPDTGQRIRETAGDEPGASVPGPGTTVPEWGAPVPEAEAVPLSRTGPVPGSASDPGAGAGVTVPVHGGSVPDLGVTLVERGPVVPGPGTPVPGYGAPPPDAGVTVRDLDVTEPGLGMAVSRPPSGRSRRRFLIGTAVGLSLGMAAGVAIGGSVLMNRKDEDPEPPGAATGQATVTTAGRAAAIDRETVIERAESWRPGTAQRVPYSQLKKHDGYRTDGSGYVSMALGLRKPGPNTISLASPGLSRRIKMSELMRGDLVIDPVGGNTARAVVIFDRWADSGHTSYWAYQQRAQYGTDHRVVRHGLVPGDDFRAYRPVNLRDGATGQDTAAPE